MEDSFSSANLMTYTAPLAPQRRRRHDKGAPQQHPALAPPGQSLILEKLPNELLGPIFEHLAERPTDVHNVRLTNRVFHNCAWPAFGSTFNDKVFHVTWASVANLIALAGHPSAACCVKTLNLSTVSMSADAAAEFWYWLTSSKNAALYRHQLRSKASLAVRAASARENEDWFVELNDQLRQAVNLLRKLDTITIIDGREL